ncbi:M64 family metallo-endopeptidase, partial [Mariniblastus sp.]|nr:M64 family metallo-endopeptidase [Mariniblastus sp.]
MFRILFLVVLVGYSTSASCFGQTLTTVMNNGDSSNRVDMIFVGDGYQASEIASTYSDHVDDTLSAFFNPGIAPFPRYQNFFNAHRVNVISNESGADDPLNNIFVDTALDATYNTSGIDRLLYFNTTKANTAVNTALSGSGID